ncbi:MAG: HlyD family secretion protein, partial [Lachnospiraceae bacterium]|nr:HlyD family secretion protein [Lachnospiraceae bacterium]
MNEQGSTRRRDWIKNAVIVFLIIMLILTFFSNTIMNYSLPEVSAEYVSSGTITTKVRGTGTVTAGDIWQVYPEESLKVVSVEVKEGDEVQEGDLLFILEPEEEEEETPASYEETPQAQINAAEEVVRAAEEALRKAKEDYEAFLLAPDLAIEVSELLQTGGSLTFAELQEQVNVYRSANESIEEKKQPYEEAITELQALLRKAQSANDTEEISRLQNVISINQDYVDELDEDIAENEEEINQLIARYEDQAEFWDLRAAMDECQNDLDEANEKLSWLKKKLSESTDDDDAIDPEVKAPVSGTVKTVNVKKGKTASADEVAVEIYPEGEDYTMTLTVTTEQAQSLSVGDVAELQNSWYYSDVAVV